MKIEYIIIALIGIWILYSYKKRIVETSKIIEKLTNISNTMITDLNDLRIDTEYDNESTNESKLSMIFAINKTKVFDKDNKYLLYYEFYDKKTHRFVFLVLFFKTEGEKENEINNYSSGMVFYTNRVNYLFNVLNKGRFKKDIALFNLTEHFKPIMKYETADKIEMSDIMKLRSGIESDLEDMGFEYNIDIMY